MIDILNGIVGFISEAGYNVLYVEPRNSLNNEGEHVAGTIWIEPNFAYSQSSVTLVGDRVDCELIRHCIVPDIQNQSFDLREQNQFEMLTNYLRTGCKLIAAGNPVQI